MTKNARVKAFFKDKFYIAGMGGSAGSLEAFKQFFSKMPPDTGVAFVIVQHLDPTHKDLMPELLQRQTKMSVFRAEEGMKVKPNCVYVIPPNKDMSILNGALQLLEPSMPRGLRLPIDFFFRHLADDQGERSIGIIVSGMGTDGTLGLKAIKAKLGMAMVQSVGSAKYDGMPKSAIETGLIDFIAPAEELPGKLINYVRHLLKAPKALEPVAAGALEKIFSLLRRHTGHDFSFYKKNTVYRRIERRMSVHQLSSIARYVRFLQDNPQEIDFLFKELLIGVTNFFRDPEAFETLKEKALPLLFTDRPKGSIIKAWVPGCASGEEAYSLAITLKEYIDKFKPNEGFKVQVFGTDIDKRAIERARQGLYPSNIAADVSSRRLERFFLKEDSGYRVKKEIREMLIFAPQNMAMDPPFIKLDIISCRNLLIYLAPEMQKKLFLLFHYALNPSGILFLGSSETMGTFQGLFSVIDNKWKFFRRKETTTSPRAMIELPLSFLPKTVERKKAVPKAKAPAVNAKDRPVISRLEQELKYTKEHLRTMVEEMQTSQEELKSSNEELQSTNEELQSINEELATSKEELESLNEELITVNAELQNKVEELSRSDNDMKNFLDSTQIATIFLDNKLNIRRFTSPASKIISLIASDIGRPLSHIAHNLLYENLIEDIKDVLKALLLKEALVESKDNKWFLMRIIPYRAAENSVDGIIITFTDVSALKKLQKSLFEAEERFRKLEEERKS